MRKIAIVRCREYEDADGVDRLIAQSITDWKEVDDQTYQMLSDSIYRMPRKRNEQFRVVELVADEGFVGRTVEEYRVYVKAELKRQAKEKAEMALKKRSKIKAKKDKEREQYEALKKKFGGEQDER